jgi:hypothetical protein
MVTLRLGDHSAELPDANTKKRLRNAIVRNIVSTSDSNTNELPDPKSRV